MQFGIILLFIIGILYLLLVKGYLWKIIVFIFGFLGMYWALDQYVPSSRNALVIIGDYNFSWAAVIPIGIILMAMAYTRVEE